jgi:hypothetical protein
MAYEFKIFENPKGCFNVVVEKWGFEREIYPLKKPWCLLPYIGEMVKKWHRSLPKHKGEPETWNLYEVPGELSYYIEYVYKGGTLIPGSDFAYDRVIKFFERYWRRR